MSEWTLETREDEYGYRPPEDWFYTLTDEQFAAREKEMKLAPRVRLGRKFKQKKQRKFRTEEISGLSQKKTE